MGGEAKVTVMVLKVNLGCNKCYRKIKKVLCSTPQIRDQLFDEKSNTVTISVICCSPENVADKISRKAGGTVKDIDIKPSQPPSKPPGDKPKDGPSPGQGPPPQQKQGPAPAAAKPNSVSPPTDKPKSAPAQNGGGGGGGGGGHGEKPKAAPQKMADGGAGGGGGNNDKPKKVDFAPMGGPPPQQQFPMGPPPQQQFPMGPPLQHGPPKPNQPAAFMSPESIPVAGYPSIFPPVVYYDGGPYNQNQGIAAPQMFPHRHQPVYQYDGYTGRPVGNGYRSDYFSDENPSTCSVM